MPNETTDPVGFNTLNADEERDEAAKGGPSVGLGIADGKHRISHPYQEDIQTQIAAKSHKKKANAVTTPANK
jgi:hypothetical protein